MALRISILKRLLFISIGSVLACGGPANPRPAPTSPVGSAAVQPASRSEAGGAATSTSSDVSQSATNTSSSRENATNAVTTVSSDPASSAFETFPSGLVVSTAELGGPAPGPKLPEGTRVLHVGDSFAGALGIELNKVFTSAGIKARLDFEKSTYIPTWASGSKLSTLVSSFKPDLVLISLGANELENPQPEARAALIQRLVKAVGSTPCVWVAPVLWDGAKSALLDVIRANLGQCVYLDSNRVIKTMPRAGDKIHPSMAVRPDWAAATARWLAFHRKPTDQHPWAIVGDSK